MGNFNLQLGCSSMSIKTAISCIKDSAFLLPALQRESVWTAEQISTLFDSIYKGFPIGFILLLRIQGNKDKNLTTFYKFNTTETTSGLFSTEEYHLDIDDTKYCVMDGQQRLTSLYRGIYSSITEKKQNKKYTYHLYFNAANENRSDSLVFAYKTENDLLSDDASLWIKVKDVYEKEVDEQNIQATKNSLIQTLQNNINPAWLYNTKKDGNQVLRKTKWIDAYSQRKEALETYLQNNQEEIIERILKLRKILREELKIGYEMISLDAFNKEEKLSRILNIFIRLNNGGKKLEPASLLYSQIATYSDIDDVRQLFDRYVNDFNCSDTEQIKFRKEHFMRLLWLIYGDTSTFKNFFVSNTIKKYCKRDNFEKVHDALLKAKDAFLKAHFTFHGKPSYNMFLPIAYYFYHVGDSLNTGEQSTVQTEIAKYYETVMSCGYFSEHGDGVLIRIKKAMGENAISLFSNGLFNFKILQDSVNALATSKDRKMEITKERVEEILNWNYNDNKQDILRIFYIMNRDWQNVQRTADDIDHMHPKKYADWDDFKNTYPTAPTDLYNSFVATYNLLPNLQLLSPSENRGEKQGSTLYDWMQTAHKNDYISYAKNNKIIGDEQTIDLTYFDFCNYKKFFDNRLSQLRKHLYLIFNIQ